MSTRTIRLHRVLRAKPERIYRAFLDADAMAKWLPPNGFTARVQHLDARIGGSYKMSFTEVATGQGHSFGGEYRELVPFERICYTDRFDDPNLPGEMQTTVTLKEVSCGTELNVVQEGLPGAIPLEMCYLGWQDSLVQLAKLVEPATPGDFALRRAGIGILWAIASYVAVAAASYFLVLQFSGNEHDRSLEAAMTSVFFFGPVAALIGFIAGFIRAGSIRGAGDEGG